MTSAEHFNGALPELRRFWSVFGIFVKPSDIRTDGRAPTLEAADPPPLPT
jgi:hypothetical protein